MQITETKYILEAELAAHETAKSLRAEISEYCGMLFRCDNTQADAITHRSGKRIAALGFTSPESGKAYEAMRRARNG